MRLPLPLGADVGVGVAVTVVCFFIMYSFDLGFTDNEHMTEVPQVATYYCTNGYGACLYAGL